MHQKRPLKVYLLAIAIPLAVGGLSALLSKNGMEAFSALRQPALAPKPAVFPIVWSILYVLMGISSALVYRSGDLDRNDALFLYGAQLFMNFFWSIFFFAWGFRFFAFLWLLGLIALVIAMIVRFREIRPAAAWLNLPYMLWLGVAAWLNLSVWLLNK